MSSSSRICVLGGCGAMGRTVVECLLIQDPKAKVTVADRVAPRVPFPKSVRFVEVNLLKRAQLVRVLRGHGIVINSTSHHFNLPVMKAALAAGIHYLDLGGLFHFTRRQLKLHEAFRQKGLTAILGMGCAPGVANVLAGWAAEELDSVDGVHIKVGGREWGKSSGEIPYAIGTIREELTLRPAIYHHGHWTFEDPISGMEWFKFPAPVGRQRIFRTLHSEVATLPISLEAKESSFKIGFSDEVIHKVLHPSRKKKIVAPAPAKKPSLPHDCEITAAVVTGRIRGKKKTVVATATVGSKGKHCSGDWDTAWPPAVVARMVLKNEIKKRGVFPPEKIVPVKPFFNRLKKAGFKFAMK